jgi:hypothetical protein
MEIKPKIYGKADKMDQLFQYFTLGTLNSAGFKCIPAQILDFKTNPLKYTDPDRMWLANNTDSAIIIRTEDGKYELLRNGNTYYGKVDGALMQDGTIIKVTDTSAFDANIPKADNIIIHINRDYYEEIC